MADTDRSIYNLRYNQVANELEGFGGGTPQWTPLIMASSGGVTSLNTITGAVTLVAGTNITLTPSGHNITIAASGGSSGITALTGYVTASGTGSVAATVVKVLGVTDGSDAAAGDVGEYVEGSGSGSTGSTDTYVNVSSIALTAGDWDIRAFVEFAGTLTQIVSLISTTNASATGTLPFTEMVFQGAFSDSCMSTMPVRVSIASPTTYYLNAQASFATGSLSVDGGITARRIR